MADRVRIPVEVTGDEQAKQDLQSVGETARSAGGQQAQTTTKVSNATKDATKNQKAFNDEAKTALTGILGQINPAMASLANIAIDVARGFGQISGALVGMAGIGVVLAGVAYAFEQIKNAAEAAERAVQRLRRQRREAGAEQGELQGDIADRLERAGILGRAQEATRTAEDMILRGLPRDLASFGAVAGQVGDLDRDQLRQVVGAYIATGRQAEFGAEPGQNEEVLNRLLAVPADAAAKALAAKLSDLGLDPLKDRPFVAASPYDRRLAAADEMLRDQGFNARDVEIAQAIVSHGADPGRYLSWAWRFVTGGGDADAEARRQRYLQQTPSGATRPMEQLAAEFREAMRIAAETQQRTRGAEPVRVTVPAEQRQPSLRAPRPERPSRIDEYEQLSELPAAQLPQQIDGQAITITRNYYTSIGQQFVGPPAPLAEPGDF